MSDQPSDPGSADQDQAPEPGDRDNQPPPGSEPPGAPDAQAPGAPAYTEPPAPPPYARPPYGHAPYGQAPYGQAPFAPPPLPAADRVRLAWQGRYQSDYLFDYWSALGWTVLTVGFYGLYVIYQLMRRMRDHNRRRLELFDGALSFAWEKAGERGLQEELTPSFQRATAHLGVLRQMTTDFRDPVIWLVLSVVGRGIVDAIAFVLLDQDLVKHDRAEGGVEYELATIYGALGHRLALPDAARVKGQHNYAGRIVATIFSFGIYLFWWYHDMMDEPNRHFRINWADEDALAQAVQELL